MVTVRAIAASRMKAKCQARITTVEDLDLRPQGQILAEIPAK